MRGRKKYAGEKYEAGKTLHELWSKTFVGEFADEPPISYVFEIVRNRRRPGGLSKRLAVARKPGEAEKLLLQYIDQHVLKGSRWSEFAKIARMFAAAERWCENRFPAADPLRSSLLTANDLLFPLAYHQKKTGIKKADLLKLWRRIAPDITQDVEDADAYKKMRELGLPRCPPPGPMLDHFLKITKAVCWKIKI